MAVDLFPTDQLLANVLIAALAPMGLGMAPTLVATEPAVIRAIKVPEEHEVMVMVKLVPEEALGEKTHPVAVPPLVKSPASRPVIDVEKASVYVNGPAVGVEIGVQVTVAAAGAVAVPLSATLPTPSLVAIARLADWLPAAEALRLTGIVHVALGATLAQLERLPTVKFDALVPVTSVSSTESVASPELVTVMFWELAEPILTFPKLVVLPTEIAPLLKVG
jgi:hypothetical protein